MNGSTRTGDASGPARVPVAIDRGSPIPLYHQLTEQLTKAIEDGVLQPGEQFENEVSLAGRLQISRPTVRRAIGILVERGLLDRRQGVGTKVTFSRIRGSNIHPSPQDDLAVDGLTHSTRVLELRHDAHNARAAEALEVVPSTPLTYLERVRFVDGAPIAVLRNWLMPWLFGTPSVSDLETRGLYELLRARGVTPTVAHQTIGARSASRQERLVLGVGVGEPLLTETHRATDPAGLVVEYAEHSYRADRYSFDVAMHPGA